MNLSYRLTINGHRLRECLLAGVGVKKTNLLIVGAMAAMLTACFGGGAHVQSQVTTVSKGKQLIDLKKAADDGAISQDDYAKEKAKILGSSA